MALRQHSAMPPGEHLRIPVATNASATRPYLLRLLRITGMHFAQAMTMCIVMDRHNLTLDTEEERIFKEKEFFATSLLPCA
jgi:hypothetical protein